MTIKNIITKTLKWTEKYTSTDMTYLAKSGFFTVAANLLISLIGFIKIIFFANLIGQEDYGIFVYVISMVALFGIISLPGIETTLIKSVAQGKEGTLILALKTRLKWSVLGTLGLLIISFWYFLQGNAFLAMVMLAGGLFLAPFNIFAMFNQFWQGKKRFDIYFKYEILSAAFVTIALITSLYLSKNILFIIITFFVSYAVFYGIFLRKTILNMSNKEFDVGAISFGKDLTLMDTIGKVSLYIDKIIIWKLLGPVPLAIYSFAETPLQKIRSFIPIVTIALPKLGEKDVNLIKDNIFKKFKKLFIISIPLTVFSIMLAPYFYKFLFPTYIDSVPYFQLLALTLIFLPFSLLLTALISESRRKELYLVNTVVPLTKIFLLIFLTPFFGIWGIVWAVIISQLLNSIALLYLFKKL